MSNYKQILSDFAEAKLHFVNHQTLKHLTLDKNNVAFYFNDEAYILKLKDYPHKSLLFSDAINKIVTGNILSILDDILKEHDNSNTQSESDSDEYRDESDESFEEINSSDDDDRYQKISQLKLDIENYEKIYGVDSYFLRPMIMIDTLEIYLKLNILDVINKNIAMAWGIDCSLPIIVKIPVSDLEYLNFSKSPKIEIFQYLENKVKQKCSLFFQLENIINTFVSEKWPNKTGIKIITKEYIDGKIQEPTCVSPLRNVSIKIQEENKTSKIDNEHISNLVIMGFDRKQAIQALILSNNDLQNATVMLLDNSDKLISAIANKIKAPKKNISKLFEDEHYVARKIQEKQSKVFLEYGFLAMITSYIISRIPTLNEYCVICDCTHIFSTGNMLKPAVCSRSLCCWSFQQLGVGANAAAEIATEAQVIDLLVCMATIAAKSNRNTVIFDPFPTIFDIDDSSKIILDAENKNYELVNTILKKMPSIESITQSKDFGNVKEKLDTAHKYCYSLFQWIIQSNRCHIIQLNERKIKSMNTPHQYLLLSAAPEKEERFNELKKQHGSTFAFHGSGIENWHSILRKGLVNASGTSLQVNGAAYGKGIYLSPDSNVSFGYSRMLVGARNSSQTVNIDHHGLFLNPDKIFCIAICEVINDQIKKSGNIWVQQFEDHVVTRFFFVYTHENQYAVTACNTEQEEFRKEILNAMQY